MSDAADAARTGEDTPGTETGAGPDTDTPLPDPERVAEYLQWGVLALLVVFSLVAAANLYGSVGRIIEVWVAEEFQPVFTAAFNLLVFLLAAAGISVLLRRLR